jgi:hypothetical protein
MTAKAAEVHRDPQGPGTTRSCTEVVTALQSALAKVVVGDPRVEGVRWALATWIRSAMLARLSLRRGRTGGRSLGFTVMYADRERGAFVPLLLLCTPRARGPCTRRRP